MNRKKKRAPPANAEIFREQIQLLQTEKELKKSLEKVKDHINRLLVSFGCALICSKIIQLCSFVGRGARAEVNSVADQKKQYANSNTKTRATQCFLSI